MPHEAFTTYQHTDLSSMATSIPLPSFKAQIPVTPPPEFQMFMKGPPPQIPRPYTQGLHQTPSSSTNSTFLSSDKPTPSSRAVPPPPASHPSIASSPDLSSKQQQQHQYPTPSPSSSATAAAAAHQLHADPTAAAAVDPRYIAMASRIASYYQQRCQAVANFQQQRCQQWANAQRQKCQEMMQAATVIVAWYIRDRISRRRKRQKRVFKRGLAARTAVAAVAAARETGNGGYRVGKSRGGEREREGGAGGGRITRGEAVRRWVMNVPIGSSAAPSSTGSRDVPADRSEVDFDMDREVPADKDSQLFGVADNLIKSHLARIDVPLLGVLSFDESESESETEEDEFMDYGDELDDGEEEEDYEDGDGEEGDDDDDDDDIVGRSGGQEELASTSKDAQLGTTIKGSRKRSHSEIS